MTAFLTINMHKTIAIQMKYSNKYDNLSKVAVQICELHSKFIRWMLIDMEIITRNNINDRL